MIFWAQIIGGFAIAFWVVSLQIKDRKNILLFQSIANLLYFVQYLLLNAFSASFMNLISTIRCFLFTKIDNKKTFYSTILFICIILLIGLITYNGILSLIPIIITIFYTISSSKSDAKWNRWCVLLAAFIWIYYNYKVGAYITIIGNIMEIISGILAVVRFKNK